MKELDKRIKRKIGALGLLGLFVAMVFAQNAISHAPAQVSWDVGGNAFGGTTTQTLGTTTNDNLAIVANSIQGVVIDGTINVGHVGIGMGGALPTARLHVVGVGNTQATTTFSLMDSGWTQLMVVEDGGNVGIGTASPDNLLDIEKSGTAKSNIDIFHITNSVNAADMDGTETSILFNQWYYDASTPAVADAGRITVGTETDWTSTVSTQDGYMAIHTVKDGSVSEQVRITCDGNVGIGTTGPDARLDVLDSSNSQLRLTHTDGSTYTDFTVDTNHDLLIQPSSTGQIKLQPTTDSTDFFQVLDANGGDPILNVDATNERVGIGISPQATLHIDGDVAFGQGLELTISGGAVTVTHSYHHIDTESDAGTDDLVTINGGYAGQILIIRNSHATRDVVARDYTGGAGNLLLAGDFTMQGTTDTLTLIYSGANWLEISRSDN
jgi:hypothetical protein